MRTPPRPPPAHASKTPFLDRSLVGQLLTFALIIGLALMLVLELYGQNILHFMGSTPVNASEVRAFVFVL